MRALLLPFSLFVGISTFASQLEVPEQAKQLGFFLGDWTCGYDGDRGRSDVRGDVSCQWAQGEHFMLCAGEWRRPDFTARINNVWGYNRFAERITWYRHWEQGFSDFWFGTFEDGELRMVEHEAIANPERRREVTIWVKPDAWEYEFRNSVKDGDWVVTEQGRCQRAGSAE